MTYAELYRKVSERSQMTAAEVEKAMLESFRQVAEKGRADVSSYFVPDDVLEQTLNRLREAGAVVVHDGFCADGTRHYTVYQPDKAPKYPNDCPCEIAAVDCDYHKDM